MDRIPKTSSKYKSDPNTYREEPPFPEPEKSHKRMAGYAISSFKKVVKLLSKIKEKTSRLKSIRQNKIARPSASNNCDPGDTSQELVENTKLSENHEQKSPLHQAPDSAYKKPFDRQTETKKKSVERAGNKTPDSKSSDDKQLPHNQDTNLDSLFIGARGASKISSMLGKGLRGLRSKPSNTYIHNHNKVPPNSSGNDTTDYVGKASGKFGQTTNETTGVLLAFQEAYQSEQTLKKTPSKALDLMESLSIRDILSDRKISEQENKPITRREVEAYIENKLARNTKQKTIAAGLAGTLTLGGFIGAGAFFLFPFLPAAVAGVVIGCAVTALFSKINQNRARKKAQKLFFRISRNSAFSKINQSLDDKIKSFNEKLKTASQQHLIGAKSAVNYRNVVNKSLFSLTHASGFLGMGARFITAFNYLSVTVRTLASFVSALFTGITNYLDRQKKLKRLDVAMMESMIPNIMGRTFPYLKAPVFTRFVIHNKNIISKALNFQRDVSNSVMLKRLSSPAYRPLKRQLQNECIKRLLKEKFCRFAGIDIELLNHLSDTEFEDRYSHVFQKFVIHKIGGDVFKDTMGAGISGTVTLSTGIFSLSFLPSTLFVVLPIALSTLGIGSIVTLLTAKHEEGKFKVALNKMITSGKPEEAIQTYLKLKKLMLEKNDNPSQYSPRLPEERPKV